MFEVKKIHKGIYLVQFEDHYQLCMHFLRFQENYESPKYAGKNFELLDLMEWYSKKYGEGAFTYALDWAGFNLPGPIILNLYPKDENRHDRLMKAIAEYCYFDNDGGNFYIIGTKKEASINTVKHEIAHAFYYVDSEYKLKMDECYINMPRTFKQKFRDVLLSKGYKESVLVDECQAYMSTGLLSGTEKEGKPYQKPFKKIFNKYFKDIKLKK